MREILFRGKRKDNSEWVCGNLVELGKESFSDEKRFGICDKAVIVGNGGGVLYNLKIIEVDSETVGQYTGLTDKNSGKIFEGDIVLITGEDEIGKVEWREDDAAFVVACGWLEKSFLKDLWGYDVEVIGNIYDNPEFLKGEGE